MGLNWLLDFLAVRLNGPKAAGKTIVINADFTDTKERYVLELENGVLNYTANKQVQDADATLILTRSALNEITLGKSTLDKEVSSGDIKIEGDRAKLRDFLSMLDNFEFWFNIVTP